jgi:putative chitinase
MTPEQLASCTGCRSTALAALWVSQIDAAMASYGIDTSCRQAAFLANVGHESGGLKYTMELWGPTPAQLRYEGRLDLGNVCPGDGRLYRGHGLIQTTGRANHVRARNRLRLRFPDRKVPDFEQSPELLGLPEWAALSAADFWDEHGLNAWADKGDFDGVCDIINRGHKSAREGDSNGFQERQALWLMGRKTLGC